MATLQPNRKLFVLLLLACVAFAAFARMHVHGSQGKVFHGQFPLDSNLRLQNEREAEVVVRHLMVRRSLLKRLPIPLPPPIPTKSPPPHLSAPAVPVPS